MGHRILGLHHVTATVGAAQEDLDFYVETLGLRLVKKTVNFDNHSVYHFYYGNEAGTPGTIWTTFPYRGFAVPPGSNGAGQIRATSFSVPAGSLDFWRDRFAALGLTAQDGAERFGDKSLEVVDPSGLVIELVANNRDSRTPWTGAGIAADVAIRGLYSVTMIHRASERTVALMTGLLNFTVVNQSAHRVQLGVGGDAPGRMMEIAIEPNAPAGRNGIGTVHHVAMAVADGTDQLQFRQELLEHGLHVTEVLDRQYFESIYFREPGGVLFEIATMKPGFAIDEAPALLGRTLKLPPWEEPNRRVIEARLPDVRVPAS